MAYIDYLRRYNDTPQYGQGGSWLSNIVNAVKSFISPQKSQPQKSQPAPQQSRPNPWSNPAPSYAKPQVSQSQVSRPNPTPAPAPSRPSYSAPSVSQSRPTVTVSRPTTSNPWSNPAPSYADPRITQVSRPSTTYNQGAAIQRDLSNIGNALGSMNATNNGFIKPSTSSYQDTLKQLLGGLVGTIGTVGTQAVKTFSPVTYEGLQNISGKQNPLEFNLSELIAKPVSAAERSATGFTGETSANAGKQQSFSTPWSGSASNPYGISTPNKTDINMRSEGIRSSVTDAGVQSAIDEANAYGKTSDTFQNDIYALLTDPNIDAQMNAAADAAWNDVLNGNLAYEDYQKKVAEEQKKILANQYAALRGDAEAQIPKIQADIESLVGGETDSLARFKDTVDQQRTQKALTYDEQMKRAVKNAKLSEGNLRNVFTNLGTAESSAFIDKLTQLAGETGQEQAGIERAKSQDVGNLDKQLLYETADTNKRISDTRRKGQEDIDAIKKYIQDLSGKEAGDISTIMTNLYNALTTGQQNLTAAKTGLAQTKMNQLAKIQDAMTNYGMQSGLLKQQYDATKNLQGVDVQGDKVNGWTRPVGMPSQVWTDLKSLGMSGTNQNSIYATLKAKYGNQFPNWMEYGANNDGLKAILGL